MMIMPNAIIVDDLSISVIFKVEKIINHRILYNKSLKYSAVL